MVRLIGKRAEQKARTFLEKKGYCCIAENYTQKCGEIDLVMCSRQDKTVLFVEVKYRAKSSFGSPLEVVTRSKQQKIIKTAQFFLLKNPSYQYYCCRFDVIALIQDQLEWVQGAFS